MSTAVADTMVPEVYRVGRRRRDTSDTFTLELGPADGSAPAPFLPGQFNMLYLFGVGEVPISISGNPGRPAPLVHTTRAVGTVTHAMSRLEAGGVLGVRGPYGSHWPVKEATGEDVVIVAGGIGLAPLRPALYRLLAQRERYGKVVLLYGARTPEDILYRKELSEWRAQFDLEVHVTVDRASGPWRGNVGVVTGLIARAPFDPFHSVAMVCGPEVMMRFTVRELERRGVAPERIFVSLERNMKCGLGLCGHCQYGPVFVCRDGPVFRFDAVRDLLDRWEV
jgi:NAD(P)H-flavin reductase